MFGVNPIVWCLVFDVWCLVSLCPPTAIISNLKIPLFTVSTKNRHIYHFHITTTSKCQKMVERGKTKPEIAKNHKKQTIQNLKCQKRKIGVIQKT